MSRAFPPVSTAGQGPALPASEVVSDAELAAAVQQLLAAQKPALVPGETRLFVPGPTGEPPQGWTWLDGMVSNGYDQGASSADNLQVPSINPDQLAYPEGPEFSNSAIDTYTRYTQCATGCLRTLSTPSVKNVYFLVALGKPAPDMVLVASQGLLAGVIDLGSPITTVERVESLTPPVYADWQVGGEFIAAVQLESAEPRLVRWSQSAGSGATLLWSVAMPAGGSAHFCRITADKFWLAPNYLLDPVTGAVMEALAPENLGYVTTAHPEHNRVVITSAGDYMLSEFEMSLEGNQIIATQQPGVPIPEYQFVALLDAQKRFWRMTPNGIYGRRDGQLYLAAGRHPQLARVSHTLWYAAVALPPDPLNQPTCAVLMVGDPGTDNYGQICVGVAEGSFNLGAMLSSFRRAAVYNPSGDDQ